MNNKNKHLQALINLAISDMHLAEEERELIYVIGNANGVPKQEIDEMINNPQPLGSFASLSETEAFEVLYNIVQLMKVDRKVYVVEIKFCEDLAVKLGYKKGVIQALSSRIFSNPAIASDQERLRELVVEYRNPQPDK